MANMTKITPGAVPPCNGTHAQIKCGNLQITICRSSKSKDVIVQVNSKFEIEIHIYKSKILVML